jgi:AcrR family transcriptional regulator
MTLTNVTELRKALREQQKCAYRDAILDSGERLLRNGGDKTITMVDIANETQISVGTLYNHFKNKEDLLAAVHRRLHRRFLEQLSRTDGDASPRQELENFIRSSLGWLEDGSEALGATRLAHVHLPTDPITPSALFDEDERQQYERLLVERVSRVLPLGTVVSRTQQQELCWIFSLLLRAAIVDWLQFSRPEPPSTRSHLISTLLLASLTMSFRPVVNYCVD